MSEELQRKATHIARQSKEHYDQHSRELTRLHVGNHVAIKNQTSKRWDIYGTITAVGVGAILDLVDRRGSVGSEGSVMLPVPSDIGALVRRNRLFHTSTRPFSK